MTCKRKQSDTDETQRPGKKARVGQEKIPIYPKRIIGKRKRSDIDEDTQQPNKKARIWLGNASLSQPMRPVVRNREMKLKFFPYDDDSVPILYSSHINHANQATFLNKPSVFLRQDALALIRRGYFTSAALGRKDIPRRTRPARIVDDCDLFFRRGRIYVVTERGLLLAADYLRLIGVPEIQHVRFEGKKPAWAKCIEQKKHRREVVTSFEPTEEQTKERFISLQAGLYVNVLERIKAVNDNGQIMDLGYGKMCGSDVAGLFPYKCTAPIENELDPININWKTFAGGRWAEAFLDTPTTPPQKVLNTPIKGKEKTVENKSPEETAATQGKSTTAKTTTTEEKSTATKTTLKEENLTIEKPAVIERKPLVVETAVTQENPTTADNRSFTQKQLSAEEMTNAENTSTTETTVTEEKSNIASKNRDTQKPRLVNEAGLVESIPSANEVISDVVKPVPTATSKPEPQKQEGEWEDEDQVDYDDD